MSGISILAKDLGFPEGPVAMADGSIILTEINGGWVTRVGAESLWPLAALYSRLRAPVAGSTRSIEPNS